MSHYTSIFSPKEWRSKALTWNYKQEQLKNSWITKDTLLPLVYELGLPHIYLIAILPSAGPDGDLHTPPHGRGFITKETEIRPDFKIILLFS